MPHYTHKFFPTGPHPVLQGEQTYLPQVGCCLTSLLTFNFPFYSGDLLQVQQLHNAAQNSAH